jgi:dTDP-4-amino-4,6-dideoxygalactose transaminase
VLAKGIFIRGDEVDLFEREFADYCGVKQAIGVANGLDAISLILRALLHLGRLEPGLEVLIPGNTFIATALAITACGLSFRLVEPETARFNIDPDAVLKAITPRTGAILAVHLYGRMADMPRLLEIAERNNLLLIEDAAQAHGASLEGQLSGSWGIASAFSLFPGKPLGALGDAGIITTSDSDLAESIRMLGNYGSRVKYYHELLGVNSRLDELQAAFLRIKLRYLDADNHLRNKIARYYYENIIHPALDLPVLPGQGEVHAWHQFVVRCQYRDALQLHLRNKGVDTLIHYPRPIHRQAAYKNFYSENLPVTSVLSLPLYPTLSHEAIDDVVAACNSFLI